MPDQPWRKAKFYEDVITKELGHPLHGNTEVMRPASCMGQLKPIRIRSAMIKCFQPVSIKKMVRRVWQYDANEHSITCLRSKDFK